MAAVCGSSLSYSPFTFKETTMPEYDVTHLEMEDCGQLFGSVFELGKDAGRITWNNCMKAALDHPLVKDDEVDEIRDYFRGYGAWDNAEIDAWTRQELDALVTQEAAAAFREYEMFDSYEEYMEAAEQGTVATQIYRDDNGRWWLNLSR
jgi:hypothetical protein